MVKGLSELGHKCDYMVHNFRDEDKWLARDCDFNLELDCTQGLQIEKGRELEFFDYAVKNYDIFHFHSGYGLFSDGYSLWNRLDELAYLKKLGKKIIMHWWGCDIRTEDVDIKYKWSACNECIPENRYHCMNSGKTEMLAKVNKYADIQLSNGDIIASYQNVQWCDNAIDCEEFRPFAYDEIPEKYRLSKTDKIRIYHSFGNSDTRGDVKGSGYIKTAVEKLISDGYPLEFVFFDKIPNIDVKYYQAQADIVVDQLRCGWHGSAGMECMAMGKPVVTYIRPEVENILPHKDHPIINANIENIYFVLKELLNMGKTVWDSIGNKSRGYALKYHNYKVVARNLESLYVDC
jgi:glycosyltransferase involved in cell wall biosynthesis